jgi:hypothetical protein
MNATILAISPLEFNQVNQVFRKWTDGILASKMAILAAKTTKIGTLFTFKKSRQSGFLQNLGSRV